MQADQDVLNLLMQSGQYIDTHRDTRDERAVQSLRCGLAILRSFGNVREQPGLNESEIDISDSLDHADIRIVRRAWMRRGLARFQSDVQRDGLVFGFTHMIRLLMSETWRSGLIRGENRRYGNTCIYYAFLI